MTSEYHKPFIKNLVIVACITIVAMFSSHYAIEYYSNYLFSPPKTLEYSSQKSQDETKSVLVE